MKNNIINPIETVIDNHLKAKANKEGYLRCIPALRKMLDEYQTLTDNLSKTNYQEAYSKVDNLSFILNTFIYGTLPCDYELVKLYYPYTRRNDVPADMWNIQSKLMVAFKKLAEKDEWWIYNKENFIAEYQNDEEIMKYYNMFVVNMESFKNKWIELCKQYISETLITL